MAASSLESTMHFNREPSQASAASFIKDMKKKLQNSNNLQFDNNQDMKFSFYPHRQLTPKQYSEELESLAKNNLVVFGKKV